MTTDSATASRINLMIRAIDVWHFHERDNLLHHISLVEVHDEETIRIPVDRAAVSSKDGLLGSACERKEATLIAASELVDQHWNQELNHQPIIWLVIPCFKGLSLTGVVVLGLSDRYGAVEVWNRDDRDELALTVGHYNGLPSFEFITRYTRFPKGAGLPGKVWSSRAVHLADNLSKNSSFIRSFGQDPAQVTSGIGLPVGTIHGFPASALLMLEVDTSPFSLSTFVLDCEVTTDGSERSIQILSKKTVGAASMEGLLDGERMEQIAQQVDTAVAPILISIQCEISASCHICLAMPFFQDGAVKQILCFTV